MRIAVKLYGSFLLAMSLQACAQVKNTVVKSNAYFMIPMPGTVRADENGNEIPPARDSVFFLYVETKEKEIKWEKAWRNGRSFSVIPAEMKEAKTIISNSGAGSQRTTISPQAGNTVWQIELSDDQKMTAAPQTIKQNEILLQGKEGNRVFYVIIKSIAEIASPEYQ